MRTTLAIALLALSTSPCFALSPATRCLAAKLGAAGRYDLCRLKAEAKATRTGGTAEVAKCESKLALNWTRAEAAAGGMCPSNGDGSAIQTLLSDHADQLAILLAGGSVPTCAADLATCTASLTACSDEVSAAQAALATCTTDLASSSSALASCESDLSDAETALDTCTADLSACAAEPSGLTVRTGQTTCFNAAGVAVVCTGVGQDGDLQRGLPIAFVDNGDGTISDQHTGLMWEKLSLDGSIHDRDLAFTWSGAFSAKIAVLNSMAFAGHSDWRLPNINELHTLANYGATNPAVHAAFLNGCVLGCAPSACACVQSSLYWSSTTNQNATGTAWGIDFYDGDQRALDKTNQTVVRAVRGGS
jgi:hypothetical protein